MILKNGLIIFDTKTDFSYSRDSRKTLTLTSKLANLSDNSNKFNYSLVLGVSHPYTNIDVKINSYIGNSDEQMTFGMNSHYLTSKKQIKNLALLAEIKKLKRKIKFQVYKKGKKIYEIQSNTFIIKVGCLQLLHLDQSLWSLNLLINKLSLAYLKYEK